MMVDFGATAIACTPSYLLHLSEVLRDEGADYVVDRPEELLALFPPLA